MVGARTRCAVARPCCGYALPWNASFMTIPFSAALGTERKHMVRAATRTGNPRPLAGGFAVVDLRARLFRCAAGCSAAAAASALWWLSFLPAQDCSHGRFRLPAEFRRHLYAAEFRRLTAVSMPYD